MRKKFKKLIGCLTALSLLASSFNCLQVEVPAQTYTAHAILEGESFEGNPLKGFVPYNYGTMEFPHSMEWFYIAVNEVHTGMNEFDWTALEEKLNDVASRGNQAVMRFYYDYPAEETGVPQFLIEQGLEMKYYNEPTDLGGDGYAPDYENETFRQSMKNFISAFGEQYDGDGRLAYVTLGLLGFWGEWHNWPYDEDTSDGRADWSISTEVYKEVLDAFDGAFDVTPLCVREPKYGIDYSGYDIGFHDDSFGYATLSAGNGGQTWSFMEKMLDFGLGNKWQTNCIGGEIYPPSQYDIFSGKEPDGTFQDWDKCMEEAHATWMLDDAMRYYTGVTLEKARQSAVEMGYDFQVTTAYYDDINATDSLYLKVDMKNIGCAPFYYDHTVWPVEIGVKQGDALVKTWRTEWDLCDVPADASIVTFEQYINNHELNAGSYSIAIKVINPLENGKILGFANQGQGMDGWLNLGTLNVIEDDEKETTQEIATEIETTKEIVTDKPQEETTQEETTEAPTSVSNTSIVAREIEDNIVIDISSDVNYESFQLYIDGDGSSYTGFLDSGSTDGGFDYLIENEIAYSHLDNNSEWKWSQLSNVEVKVETTDVGKVISIAKSSLPLYNEGGKIKAKFLDSSWTTIDATDIVDIQGKNTDIIITEDIEINGYQISTVIGGIRTVYSVDATVENKNVSEVGLIYGIQDAGYDEADMIVNSKSSSVYVSKGTVQNGLMPEVYSKAESYAMTMRFAAGTYEEFETKFYVRAYAKLEDGTCVYTTVSEYTIYNVADSLYKKGLMKNQNGHDYLYHNILTVVNPEYTTVEYGWSDVVKP